MSALAKVLGLPSSVIVMLSALKLSRMPENSLHLSMGLNSLISTSSPMLFCKCLSFFSVLPSPGLLTSRMYASGMKSALSRASAKRWRSNCLNPSTNARNFPASWKALMQIRLRSQKREPRELLPEQTSH